MAAEDLRAVVLDRILSSSAAATPRTCSRSGVSTASTRCCARRGIGIVLTGSSAGGICWFEQGVTDSFGPQLGPMDCLGFLPGSFCPHWDDEELRRPRYYELLATGSRGLRRRRRCRAPLRQRRAREVVACEEGSKAYRVELREGEWSRSRSKLGSSSDRARPDDAAFIEAVLAAGRRRRRAAGDRAAGRVSVGGRDGSSGCGSADARGRPLSQWCPHAVVLDGQMIGHAGFHGPPGVNSTNNPEAVEFGYRSTRRGAGAGTRRGAADADGPGRGVGRDPPLRPLGLADNEPSLAIVRKFGFVRTGEHMDEEDGLELVFELGGTPAARPELGDPGGGTQAEPNRREQEVEEQAGDEEQHPPDGPAPERDGLGAGCRRLRVHAGVAAAAWRRSTIAMIRAAVSSIESSEISITGQPSLRWSFSACSSSS